MPAEGLHAHPELSGHETETAAEITRRLEADGYTTHQIDGGVVGVLENGAGPVVLHRADIDALPVRETTGLPYASEVSVTDDAGRTVPVMHACGHDVHITTALGAAHLLATSREAWSGTHLTLFQPAEETAAGAHAMVEAGLVEVVPRPEVALAQHVLGNPPADMVGTRVGPMLSTGCSVSITIHGESAHGSMPHLGSGRFHP